MRHRIFSAALPLLASALLLALALPAAAQPFGGTFSLSSADPGYVAIPNSADLNPTGAITVELWASVGDTGGGCKSLVGKDFVHAYWVGICGRTLRSYLRGSSSLFDGGTIPLSELTHIAVTFDGATRRHYINGELVASLAEAGPLPTTSQELRIGSDVSYNVVPNASFSEVRLWSVARTQAQIRSAINVQLTAPQTGLVAAWASERPTIFTTTTGRSSATSAPSTCRSLPTAARAPAPSSASTTGSRSPPSTAPARREPRKRRRRRSASPA